MLSTTQKVSEAKPKLGDLIRFIPPPYHPYEYDDAVYAEKIGPGFESVDLETLAVTKDVPRTGVYFRDFAVFLQVLSRNPFGEVNSTWKVLHPDHGMLLVGGVSLWLCEVIAC